MTQRSDRDRNTLSAGLTTRTAPAKEYRPDLHTTIDRSKES